MTRLLRAFPALIVIAAIAACNGNGSAPLVPGSPESAAAPATAAHEAIPAVAAIDIGRRAPNDRVQAVVLLRYNHQAELDRFVANLVTAPRTQYLTRDEFAARYAPTQQQQQRAIDILRAAGFTVDKTYPNRTTLDVSASSATAERTFATEIHDFAQGKYGRRYANVTPIRIPQSLAPYVGAVDIRSVVAMHSDMLMTQSLQPPPQMPDAGTNAVRNPGFETGHLKPWTTCNASTNHNKATIQKVHPHSGRYDAYAGTYQGQSEPQGITSVCQVLTIPTGATLTAYSWGISNDRSGVKQFGAIFDYTSGKLIKAFWNTDKNNKNWQTHHADLSSYAGRKVYLAFGVVGNSRHTGKTIGQLVDDVSLTGTTGTPTPPPPQTLPCPSAAAPTPTPAYASNDGWGPASVQDGLCMPVNYGYDGTGETAGIVIDKEVSASDLSDYLTNFGITRSGTVSYTLIDGAAAVNDDEGEATLDLETIAGLAPGANVIVYVTGDLSNQHILDAYQTALNDTHHVGVVNSSFGGCESLPSSANNYDHMANAIAEQGAAVGMTFSASSGDQGADCFNGNPHKFPFGAQGPASAPYFVGVGGNQSTIPFVTSNDICSSHTIVPATINNPVEWNDCVGSGGGGVSAEWASPTYQSFTGSTKRIVPDIELPAVEDAICYHGPCKEIYYFSWTMIWGTSWASPIYVAMQTEVNQACTTPQWGIATIYGAYGANSYKHFIDVTSGDNLWTSPYAGSSKAYKALVGFDAVSGIGMPLGMFLAQDRCNAAAIRHR